MELFTYIYMQQNGFYCSVKCKMSNVIMVTMYCKVFLDETVTIFYDEYQPNKDKTSFCGLFICMKEIKKIKRNSTMAPT